MLSPGHVQIDLAVLVAGRFYAISIEGHEGDEHEAPPLQWALPGDARQAVPKASLFAPVAVERGDMP